MSENNDDTTTDELPGDSHLIPSYRPDWNDGQIHLEGELDFPADKPAADVAESLADRAEQIGAIVSHDRTNGEIDCYPWNGPGYFRLCYDTETDGATVDRIQVYDRNNDLAADITVPKLKQIGEANQRLVEAVESVEIVESERYRVTSDGFEPVQDGDDTDE